jgi:glyoxylate reductase
MSKPNVLLALRVPDEVLARIEAECLVASVGRPGLPVRDDLIEALAGVEGLLGSAMLPLDAELLAAAPRLRVISNFGVGYDNVDLPAATERRIVVCNTPDVLTDAVADLTMALVLALSRRLIEAERFVRDGEWQPGRAMALGSDVSGKTLGVIGLGRIGRGVAARAKSFGMRVCFHDVVREVPDEWSFCTYSDLDALLHDADFVSLHTNLTPETRGLIGARELSLMKPTVYLINTSRGQILQQPAVTEALREGRIAGAALDVFEREPLALDDPLRTLPNVILLPHIGSATTETRAAMLDLAVENLLTALRGETPRSVVNPEALERRSGT